MNEERPPKKIEPGTILPEGFANWSRDRQAKYIAGEIDESGNPISKPKQESTENRASEGPVDLNVPDYSSPEEKKEDNKVEDPGLENKFELVKKLKDIGIKIEMVDALPNLAIYDEGEKTLRVRRDASPDFVSDYVNNSIFAKQDGIDKLDPNVDRSDWINIEGKNNDNEGSGGLEEDEEKPPKLDDLGYQPKSEEEIEKEKGELSEKIKSAQNLDELYAVLRSAGRVQGSRSRFYDAEKLIADIDKIKEFADQNGGGIILEEITRGSGLRDKVRELIIGKKEEQPVEVLPVEQEELKAPEKEPEPKLVNVEVLPPEPKVSKTIPSPIVDVKAEEVPNGNKEENIHNWRESEEWKQFEKIEKDVAEARAQKRGEGSILGMDANLDNLEDVYEAKRKQIALLIESDYRQKNGLDEGPLPREQQRELNDLLVKETIEDSKKRRQEHLDALKTGEDKNWKTRGLEVLRKATKIKAVEWYLKQDKWTRAATNTAIFGVAIGAGTFVGGGAASVALGAVAYRGARAAGSILGSGLGVAADRKFFKEKQIDKVNEQEKIEIDEIKNDNFLSAKDKESKLDEIKSRYSKEKKWIMMRKAGMAIVGGLLGGSAAGGILDFAYGGASVPTESQGSKGGGTTEPSVKPAPEATPSKPAAPETPKTPEPEPVLEAKLETKPLFTDPSILKHQNVKGDSTWKILEKTLENNDKFKGLTEAQKTYVVSNFTNKIIENPDVYGVGKGGTLEIGKQTDLTKLFEDSKEAESIFEKARETVKAGSMREETILENNAKIATWLKEHPDEYLSEGKVSEILSTKPKVFFTKEQVPEFTQNELEALENDGVRLSKGVEKNIETPQKIGTVDDAAVQKPNVKAGNVIDIAEARAKLEEEISEYKQRLAQLEGNKSVAAGGMVAAGVAAFPGQSVQSMTRNPNIERSMVSDGQVAAQVEEAFHSVVDDIYGKGGLLGFGRVAGVDAPEWRQMAGLPVAKVIKYYTGNSNDSGLSLEVSNMLFNSKKHTRFAKEMLRLLEQTNDTIKPFENERVEQFVKRAAAYVFKSNLQSKAA